MRTVKPVRRMVLALALVGACSTLLAGCAAATPARIAQSGQSQAAPSQTVASQTASQAASPRDVALGFLKAIQSGDASAAAKFTVTGVEVSAVPAPPAGVALTAGEPRQAHASALLKTHPALKARGIGSSSEIVELTAGWKTTTPGVGVNFVLLTRQGAVGPWRIVRIAGSP